MLYFSSQPDLANQVPCLILHLSVLLRNKSPGWLLDGCWTLVHFCAAFREIGPFDVGFTATENISACGKHTSDLGLLARSGTMCSGHYPLS